MKKSVNEGPHPFPFTFYCVRAVGRSWLSTNEGHLISSPPPHSPVRHAIPTNNLSILNIETNDIEIELQKELQISPWTQITITNIQI